MANNYKIMFWLLLIGMLFIIPSVWLRITKAAESEDFPVTRFCKAGESCGDKGEQLDLVSYLFVQKDKGQGVKSYGLGVFLGTYNLVFNYCNKFHAEAYGGGGTAWRCSGVEPDNSGANGYGLLYLQYPGTCEVAGGCYMVPKVKIAIPVKEGDGKWHWWTYALTGVSGGTGHEFSSNMDDVCPDGGCRVDVRTVLADFDVQLLP